MVREIDSCLAISIVVIGNQGRSQIQPKGGANPCLVMLVT
jgi:hypothetical protein